MPTCKDCNKRDPLRHTSEGHWCEYLEIFVPDDESSEGCDGFFAGQFCYEEPVCPDCDGEGVIDEDLPDEYHGHQSVSRVCPTCGGNAAECEIEDED